MTPNKSLFLGQYQQQQLSQRFSLQLRQWQQMVTCPTLEFKELLIKALDENPILEVVDNSETASKDEEISNDNKEKLSPELVKETDVTEFLDNIRDYEAKPSRIIREISDRKTEAMQNTPDRAETLQDYVWSQFMMQDLPKLNETIAREIIYNISDDGYLRVPLQDISAKVNSSVESVEKVLHIIQKLDPPGISARTPTECLLLQLDQDDSNLELKRTIITQYLEYLQPHKITNLAKLLGKSANKIQCVAEEIKLLNPHPASNFSSPQINNYITPDVIIVQIEGVYEIIVNSDYAPSVLIKEDYRQIASSKEINAAKAIIKIILIRKVTIRQMAELILDKQRDFFDKGVEYLKPLRMKEIAELFHVNLSTISRIVSNKYVQTPHGLFPMKFFFASTTETAGGNFYSHPSILAALKEIIDKEDKQQPYKDSILVKMLVEKQFIVSRRTVSKYRQVLNIPNYSLRRTMLRK